MSAFRRRTEAHRFAVNGMRMNRPAARKKGAARLEVVDGVPVIDVDGEVDIANVDEFEALLRAAVESGAGAVVIALENARYFDSAAIHALLSCRARQIKARQGFLVVRPATAAGRRVLEICGLLRDGSLVASRGEGIEMAKQIAAQRRIDGPAREA